MEALFDRRGRVYGWLSSLNGSVFNVTGQNIAFVIGDSVYDLHGKHVGWWQNQNIRNHSGQVALFLREARQMGPVKPMLQAVPDAPAVTGRSARPVLAARPAKRTSGVTWAPMLPF